MAEIKDGLLLDGKITQKTVSNIEHQTLNLKKVTAVIIHQTDSYNAENTIKGYGSSLYGAHFTIGRCCEEFAETKESLPKSGKGIYTGKKVSYSGEDGKIYQTARLNRVCWHAGKLREKKYPNNFNSIGIEFVGKYDWVRNAYPPPSVGQIQSGAWLVKTLIQLITTIPSIEAVYAHGIIAFKTPDKTEGSSTLEKISEELKPKAIKVETSCTEIQNLLFPYLCNPSNVLFPNNKP